MVPEFSLFSTKHYKGNTGSFWGKKQIAKRNNTIFEGLMEDSLIKYRRNKQTKLCSTLNPFAFSPLRFLNRLLVFVTLSLFKFGLNVLCWCPMLWICLICWSILRHSKCVFHQFKVFQCLCCSYQCHYTALWYFLSPLWHCLANVCLCTEQNMVIVQFFQTDSFTQKTGFLGKLQ